MDHDDDTLWEQDHIQIDHLAVGLTRTATLGGVPLLPLLIGELAVFVLFGLVGNPFCLLAGLPVYAILHLLSDSNPRIFAEIGAWWRVHARCKNGALWGAASFSPRRTTQWEIY